MLLSSRNITRFCRNSGARLIRKSAYSSTSSSFSDKEDDINLFKYYQPKSFGSDEAIENVQELITLLTVRNQSHRHIFLTTSTADDIAVMDVLRAVEMVQSGLPVKGSDIQSIFNKYEKRFQDSQVEKFPWEELMVAASFQWYAGNYLKAAALFESALGKSPFDPLVLKLSQDNYRAAGLSKEQLGCVTRYSDIHNVGQIFRPTIYALLSLGSIETSKFQEAEDLSSRSVEMSAYRDIAPLISLCTSFYFSGKTSEITEYYNKYGTTFDTGDGRHHFTCIRSHALIARGNCHGAFNAVTDILEQLPNERPRSDFPVEQVISFPLLVDITMLLWHMNIHLTRRHKVRVDTVIDELLAHLKKYEVIPIDLKYFCEAVLLAIKLNGLETKNTKSQIIIDEKVARQQQGESSGSSGFFTSIFGRKKFRHIARTGDSRPPGLTMSEEDYEMNNDVVYDEDSLKEINQVKNELKELLSILDTMVEAQNNQRKREISDFPYLSQIKPLKHLPYGLNEASSSHDRVMNQRKDFFLNATKGIIAFALRDYHQAIVNLSKDYTSNYKVSGLGPIQRDVFHQTFIESFIRFKDFEGAQALLLERTATVPSDGQNWARLARVYRILNKTQDEEHAQLMAHQFGIGQGGFGGTL